MVKARSLEQNKLIGQRLYQARKENQLSQQDVAKLLNVTFQQIQKYEKGANSISLGALLLLSEKLDRPLNYFFQDFSIVDHLGKEKADYSEFIQMFEKLSFEQQKAIQKMMRLLLE